MKAKLVLESGHVFVGYVHQAIEDRFGELVFYTGVSGYQEVLSDMSYCDQLVVMNFPEIGVYGINEVDFESMNPTVGGLIVNQVSDTPDHYQSMQSVNDYVEAFGIALIEGIDTRYLVSLIKQYGHLKALITCSNQVDEQLIEQVRGYIVKTNQVSRCSVSRPQRFQQVGKRLVVIDCGVKTSMIRMLFQQGYDVLVLPYNSHYSDVMRYKPDALFISNGPGDPNVLTSIVELVHDIQGKVPIIGVGLGCQLIAIANGAKVVSLRVGHRGENHPVRSLKTNRVYVTSQNHGFLLDENSLNRDLIEVTHRHVMDGSVEGICVLEKSMMGIQFYPKLSTKGVDEDGFFRDMNNMIEQFKGGEGHA